MQPRVVPFAVPPLTLTTATLTSQSVLVGFETGFVLTEKVAPSSESVVGLVCHGGEVCEFEADEGAGGATSTRPMNESIDDEGAMDADDERGGATVE